MNLRHVLGFAFFGVACVLAVAEYTLDSMCGRVTFAPDIWDN